MDGNITERKSKVRVRIVKRRPGCIDCPGSKCAASLRNQLCVMSICAPERGMVLNFYRRPKSTP